jgi:hypothetical protein
MGIYGRRDGTAVGIGPMPAGQERPNRRVHHISRRAPTGNQPGPSKGGCSGPSALVWGRGAECGRTPNGAVFHAESEFGVSVRLAASGSPSANPAVRENDTHSRAGGSHPSRLHSYTAHGTPGLRASLRFLAHFGHRRIAIFRPCSSRPVSTRHPSPLISV